MRRIEDRSDDARLSLSLLCDGERNVLQSVLGQRVKIGLVSVVDSRIKGIIRPVQEDDGVCVLFDVSGSTQVIQHRTPCATVVVLTLRLGQCHHRDFEIGRHLL